MYQWLYYISHYNLGSILSVLQQYFEFFWGMCYLKTILYFSKLSATLKVSWEEVLFGEVSLNYAAANL